LVVLDNFEQVMDGATIVADLLAACPPLRVVVTSRERLRLRGEYEFVLEPLTVPDPDTVDPVEVVATPAGALFAQRAAAATLGFKADGGNAAAVASICRDTDGLPLAIELAAARVRDFPIDELASRLTTALDVLVEGQRDLPTRQQTLRTAIGWSYDLLNPIEQRMFKALATFAGGASASALRAVTGGRTDVVATMAALGAKSLVLEVPTADDEGRWWALETIHQFGLELLARDPEKGALAQAHAARFVELARRAAAELTGADQAQWLARLDTDLENLRLALERGSTAQRLSLTAALARFWLNRGYWSEGRRWLERALESPGGNDGERLMVLLGACHLAQRQGDLHRATTHAQDGLALAARIDDVVMRAQFLNQLGEIARHQGDADRGLSMLADALTVARAGGDERVIGLVLNNIGVIQLTLLQDFAGARATYAEALAIHRATSAHRDTATTLNNLAICALATGDFADGANLALEGREVAEAIGDAALGAQFDLTLAEAAQALGRLDEARSRLESSLAAYELLGDTTGEAATAMALAHVCAETGDTTTGAQLARRARAGWAAKDRADLVLACDELLTGLSSGSPPRSPR
jgi:non-specific serine/threonine protein kinase